MKPYERPRCGVPLKRTGEPCARPLNHPSPDRHLSQLAVDHDNDKQSRYYKRDSRKKVRITTAMDFSVADDLRTYVEASGLTQQAVIESAVSGYLSGGFYV